MHQGWRKTTEGDRCGKDDKEFNCSTLHFRDLLSESKENLLLYLVSFHVYPLPLLPCHINSGRRTKSDLYDDRKKIGRKSTYN